MHKKMVISEQKEEKNMTYFKILSTIRGCLSSEVFLYKMLSSISEICLSQRFNSVTEDFFFTMEAILCRRLSSIRGFIQSHMLSFTRIESKS